MQVSKDKLKSETKKEVFNSFYQVLADLKKREEVEIFCQNFFTKVEQTILVKRLAIAYALEKNKSYDEIKNNLKVSSATIANIDKMMLRGKRGFALVLSKIEADRWASDLAKKISKKLKKLF